MQSFKIMVDTSCDLPPEFIDEHEIGIIPMPFNLDGVAHPDGGWQDISDKDFYMSLRKGSLAGTALINPDAYEQVFTQYAKKGEGLVVLTLASGLSGTYHNSVIALNDVKEKFPDSDIHTVNSTSAASGFGLAARLAVKKRAEGASASETAAWLREKLESCLSLFTVDDLMYLHRGGRLSKISAVAGSILGVKPLLNIAPDNTLCLKNKVRGRKTALETLVSQMRRAVNADTALDTVLISHTDCAEDAEKVAELVKTSFKVRRVLTIMMNPVVGAHVGPGCVALFFESDMTRTEYEAKFYG